MQPIEEKERFTLSKIVSDSLRDYIITNKLSTGDKLPSERELAKMLDVSRVIIREALHSLESTGILTIKHGGGAYINSDDSSVIFNNLLFFWQMKDKNSDELFDLRLLLEKEAIAHIISQSNQENLGNLEAKILLMKDTDEPEKFKEYDRDFHRELISTTQNELFMQLADIIVQYFANVSPPTISQLEKEQTIHEHQLLLQALKDRDKKVAYEILEGHLQRSIITKSKS
ncbi:transcriptional regulator, pyruvate dehydrogenase complex repressor [Neobacillus bataviensis LMG 21833]|uniref:Transcriptional regulator, pyruvate dehydrogenase complex repressor n=1 Tax=Neobacillus bataviensis LMG 21833 TaxID=1117379 RepID=K6E045_9BACI|nr:GntR family transcriptional regulator [Neobacillus bataviensis]EKN66496.1 transcriptional regulator, pyruvate dehydrogenase complex repressor [Neobacillus bataviensis LMG 21833]